MSGRRRQSATPAPAGGQDPKRTRSEVLPPGRGVEKGSTSSAPAMVVVRDLMVDEHVLECVVCYLPLKPPIFQCGVGHVLCSPCSEKIKDAGKCHLCGVAMAGGYRRCRGMEDVMNSIRGPCPYAPYGCEATPSYHAREEHIRQCPHAPCHCPGDGCGFVGDVTTLVEHLAAAHSSWPCTAEAKAGAAFNVKLRDGFNFLTAVRGGAKYLFLLNMVSTPFGRAISAVRIGSVAATASSSAAPATAAMDTTCDLELSYQLKHLQSNRPKHYQSSREGSRFQVECRCPSKGLPDPNASFQFFIPKCVGGSNEATALVKATIFFSSS